MTNDKIIEHAVEIAAAAVSHAGDKAALIVNNPGNMTEFIGAVYSKLVELDKRG